MWEAQELERFLSRSFLHLESWDSRVPPSDPRPAMFLSRTLWQVSGASVAQGSETTAGPPWHQRHCLVGLASTYRDHWLLERFQADST